MEFNSDKAFGHFSSLEKFAQLHLRHLQTPSYPKGRIMAEYEFERDAKESLNDEEQPTNMMDPPASKVIPTAREVKAALLGDEWTPKLRKHREYYYDKVPLNAYSRGFVMITTCPTSFCSHDVIHQRRAIKVASSTMTIRLTMTAARFVESPDGVTMQMVVRGPLSGYLQRTWIYPLSFVDCSVSELLHA